MMPFRYSIWPALALCLTSACILRPAHAAGMVSPVKGSEKDADRLGDSDIDDDTDEEGEDEAEAAASDLVGPPNPFAQVHEAGIGNAEFTYQNTSDGIIDKGLTLSYRTHRRDLFWPYDGEAPRAWDFLVDAELHSGLNYENSYEGYRVSLGIARKFSEAFLIQASVGPDIFSPNASDYGAGGNTVTPYADAKVQWHPNDAWEIAAGYNRDFVYQELIQPGGSTLGIIANTISLDLTEHPGDHWRVASRNSFRFFSDSNTRRDTDLSVMYGISIGVPWIWVGAGAEYLGFSMQTDSYWTPQAFYAGGPRAEVDFPIIGRLDFIGGINVNQMKQDSYAPGLGFYASSLLSYGLRDGKRAEIGYAKTYSLEGQSLYSANAFTLAIMSNL